MLPTEAIHLGLFLIGLSGVVGFAGLTPSDPIHFVNATPVYAREVEPELVREIIIPPEMPNATRELVDHLYREAERFGADPEKMMWTLQYENGWTNRPSALVYGFDNPSVGIVAGTPERSYGYCQINLDYHPYISRSQAEDPFFCISWMAEQFGADRGVWWSMYRHLYGTSSSRHY